MPKLRQIQTPLNYIKIRLLQDETTNKYYIKFPFQSGRGSRLRNFVLLLSLLVAGGVGTVSYQYGMQYASDKMIDQLAKEVLTQEEVTTLLEDPEVKKLVQEQLALQGVTLAPQAAPAAQATTTEPSQPTKPDPVSTSAEKQTANQAAKPQEASPQRIGFSTKEEALQFLLTKFSMAELRQFASLAQGGLTGEEREQIKSTLLSRLTPDEFHALKVLGLVEISKNPQYAAQFK